ncbi:MAG: hypothetical protein MJZ37_11190, partial [Bacilli bacterium]|nr:hypothetical protein [Bacilli bacterium]
NVLIGECDSNKSHNHTTNSQSTSSTGPMSGNSKGSISVNIPWSSANSDGNLSCTSTNMNFVTGTGAQTVVDKISSNVAHTHNFIHTHEISNSGSTESKPINLTTKLWRRIA